MTKEFLKDIDYEVEKIMEDWKVPGLALTLVKDNKPIYSKGYGYRDIKNEKKVTLDTVFAIGSLSKSFTSTAMGILVDRGLLDLDRPVRDYMADFRMKDQVASERITARDILCHRTGLPRHDLMWYNSTASRKELVNMIGHLELNKDIRTSWQYNNLMYTLAGYLIQVITGKTWEEFVKLEIFDKLGMANSNFSVNKSQSLDDFALPYIFDGSNFKEIPFRNLDSIAPAGSINSSITDMVKWLKVNLNKGKLDRLELVKEDTLAQIQAPHIPINLPWEFKELTMSTYGLGWMVESYRGHKLVHHNGGIDGFLAYMVMLTEENFGLIVLCNMDQSYSTSALAYKILDMYLGIRGRDWNKDFKLEIDRVNKSMADINTSMIPEQVKATRPSCELTAYEGRYSNPGYGLVEIKQVGGGLVVEFNGFLMELNHHHFDMFTFSHPVFGQRYLAMFHLNPEGEIGQVSIPMEMDPSVKPIIFKRLKG